MKVFCVASPAFSFMRRGVRGSNYIDKLLYSLIITNKIKGTFNRIQNTGKLETNGINQDLRSAYVKN